MTRCPILQGPVRRPGPALLPAAVPAAGLAWNAAPVRPLRRPAAWRRWSAAWAAALGLTLNAGPAQAQAASKPAGPAAAPPAAASAARPALTVAAVQPTRADLALSVAANGSLAAWQEASIGTEANGLRLAEVLVNVGDRVRRGQVLARFASDTVKADQAQARASVAEAQATLLEAAGNAQRARDLQSSGALSQQQVAQALTAERTAQARLEAAQAQLQAQELRLKQTQVLAPDDGVISARSATLGAVLPAGQELYRLIRQGRLEWRAEVPATELTRLKPGMVARIQLAPDESVSGRVRMVAPTVDPQTRNGLVYVDLPASPSARAGAFARGEFELARGSALTLPQSAVVLRDGFSYVHRIGADGRVAELKVQVGRRVGDRVEVLSGLDAQARVVAAGGGFLADGDLVKVVSRP